MAIGTILSGPTTAAAIMFIPRLMAVPADNDDAHHDNGPPQPRSQTPGSWVATIVIFWMFALASTIYVTSMYYLQQRRPRQHT